MKQLSGSGIDLRGRRSLGTVYRRPTDYNSYKLGRISRHNIVIVGTPAGEYGTAPSAIVAAQMMHSFESIRFILSLGIAGAVPQNDVRL
jgi:nucleoside phosphorylase